MAASSGKISIPTSLLPYIEFNDRFFRQHNALGKLSPLNSFTDINWKDMEIIANDFKKNNKSGQNFKRSSTFSTKARNNYKTELMNIARSVGQLLKPLNKQNLRALEEWGYSVNIEQFGKISFPTEDLKFIQFFDTLLEKNDAMGDQSPLLKLPNVNWLEVKETYQLYINSNDNKQENNKLSEQANKDKRNDKAVLLENQNKAKNYLKTMDPNNLKSLEDWGFKVTFYHKKKKKTDLPPPTDTVLIDETDTVEPSKSPRKDKSDTFNLFKSGNKAETDNPPILKSLVMDKTGGKTTSEKTVNDDNSSVKPFNLDSILFDSPNKPPSPPNKES